MLETLYSSLTGTTGKAAILKFARIASPVPALVSVEGSADAAALAADSPDAVVSADVVDMEALACVVVHTQAEAVASAVAPDLMPLLERRTLQTPSRTMQPLAESRARPSMFAM
jgi:hypothetical protein